MDSSLQDISEACFSYDPDFKSLPVEGRVAIVAEAKKWFKAFNLEELSCSKFCMRCGSEKLAEDAGAFCPRCRVIRKTFSKECE